MKEIKAYIRPDVVERVVRALQDSGVPHLTVTHVRSLGSGIDPDDRRISFETGGWYSDSVKLEFVCAEPEVDGLVAALVENARTGEPGDGVVFVHPVDRAVKVRSGTEGRLALR